MITLATYTFYKVIMASINFVKARTSPSPLVTTIRNIAMADAAMSVLPLQSSMLYMYMRDDEGINTHIMTIATGTGICIVFLFLGISMIIRANKQIQAD